MTPLLRQIEMDLVWDICSDRKGAPLLLGGYGIRIVDEICRYIYVGSLLGYQEEAR